MAFRKAIELKVTSSNYSYRQCRNQEDFEFKPVGEKFTNLGTFISSSPQVITGLSLCHCSCLQFTAYRVLSREKEPVSKTSMEIFWLEMFLGHQY